jgi:hypothetical protein
MEVLKITGSGRTLEKNGVKAAPTSLHSEVAKKINNYGLKYSQQRQGHF